MSNARDRAYLTYEAKQQSIGSRRITVRLSPEATRALASLEQRYGTTREAITETLIFAARFHAHHAPKLASHATQGAESG